MVLQKTPTPELVHMARPMKDQLGRTKHNHTYEVIIPSVLDDHVRLWTDEIPWEACPSLESFGQGRAVLDSLIRP